MSEHDKDCNCNNWCMWGMVGMTTLVLIAHLTVTYMLYLPLSNRVSDLPPNDLLDRLRMIEEKVINLPPVDLLERISRLETIERSKNNE